MTYRTTPLAEDISRRIINRVARREAAYTLADGHRGWNDRTPTVSPQSMTPEWDWLIR